MSDYVLSISAVFTGVSVQYVDSPIVSNYLAIITVACGTVAIIRAILQCIKIIRDVIRKRKTLDRAVNELDEILEVLEDMEDKNET